MSLQLATVNVCLKILPLCLFLKRKCTVCLPDWLLTCGSTSGDHEVLWENRPEAHQGHHRCWSGSISIQLKRDQINRGCSLHCTSHSLPTCSILKPLCGCHWWSLVQLSTHWTHTSWYLSSSTWNCLHHYVWLDQGLPLKQASDGEWGQHILHAGPENGYTTGLCSQPSLLHCLHRNCSAIQSTNMVFCTTVGGLIGDRDETLTQWCRQQSYSDQVSHNWVF